jgi:hypothetical protein
MLIPQTAPCETERHGSGSVSLAELRRALAKPSALGDGYRRRLRDLAQHLARVQALGDEYSRVGFSPAVRSAVACYPILST